MFQIRSTKWIFSEIDILSSTTLIIIVKLWSCVKAVREPQSYVKKIVRNNNKAVWNTDRPPAHLVNLVAAWRAGCHVRWDEFDPPHGPPRLLPEPPRWPPVDPVGPPDDWCCHGAQRLGHALWFHGHDQPPKILF